MFSEQLLTHFKVTLSFSHHRLLLVYIFFFFKVFILRLAKQLNSVMSF